MNGKGIMIYVYTLYYTVLSSDIKKCHNFQSKSDSTEEDEKLISSKNDEMGLLVGLDFRNDYLQFGC